MKCNFWDRLFGQELVGWLLMNSTSAPYSTEILEFGYVERRGTMVVWRNWLGRLCGRGTVGPDSMDQV